jgi:hypothetical protein
MVAVWKRIGLFTITLAVLYASAMWVMAHMDILGRPLVFRTGDYYNWPGGHSWTNFHEFNAADHYDAVIIGSSHAYRGYDPQVFAERGYTAYNLGSNAQTPLNSLPILRHYLDSHHHPLLIFDVYEGVFTNTGLESTADLTQNITSGPAALDMAWYLGELRGLNMMALRFCTPHRQPLYTDPHPVRQGFLVVTDSVGSPMPPNHKSLTILPRQVEFFKDCVNLCRERGIQMVVSQHQARAGTNHQRHEIFKACIDSVLAGTGIPFLDFTFAPGLDDLDNFADNNHLNASGARIFTGQLVDSLVARGFLSKGKISRPGSQ